MKFPVGVHSLLIEPGRIRPVSFFRTADGMAQAVLDDGLHEVDDFDDLFAQLLSVGCLEFRVPCEFPSPGPPPTRRSGHLTIRVSSSPAGGQPVRIYTIELSSSNGRAIPPLETHDVFQGIEAVLTEANGPGASPPLVCSCCKFGEYEEHGTVGTLRCHLRSRDRFLAAAERAATDPAARYDIFGFPSNAVDDFDTCSQFDPRPTTWGYQRIDAAFLERIVIKLRDPARGERECGS